MNGTDHQVPQPWLGRVVAEANALQDPPLRCHALARYLATAPTDGLTTWSGELRSGARSNLLMGVVSNRVDVSSPPPGPSGPWSVRPSPPRPLHAGDGVARAVVGPGLARGHPQRRPRLDLRLLGRRRGRRRPPSFQRVPLDRRGRGRLGPGRARPLDGPAGTGRRQRLGPRAQWDGRTGSGCGDAAGTRRPGPLRTPAASGTDDARRHHRAHRARHAAGPAHRQRRLGPGGDGHRGRHRDRPHGVDRRRGAAGRPHRPGEAGPLHPPRRPPRRHGARAPRPTADPAHRRPGGAGARLRLVGVHPGTAHPPGDRLDRGERHHAGQRSGHRGRRPGRRDVLGRRRARVRATGGRGRSGRFLQLLPPRSDTRVDRPTSVSVALGEAGPVRATAVVTAVYEWPDHVDGASQKRAGTTRWR